MKAVYYDEAELFAEMGQERQADGGRFGRTPHRRRCAFATYGSGNDKLKGLCSTTYASQWSCPRPDDGHSPKPCPLYHQGCYGEYDFVKNAMKGVREHSCTPLEVAEDEAEALKELGEFHECPLPVRLHTIGDCSSPEAAGIVAGVCGWYIRHTGAPIWNYTHAWNVPRKTWGKVSVLLSCHSPQECVEALHRGYAPALLVQEYESQTPYALLGGLRGIPCPSIAYPERHFTCAQCGLCWDDQERRRKREVVLFSPHGSGVMRAANVACRGSCAAAR